MSTLLAQAPPAFELVRATPPSDSSAWLWWTLAGVLVALSAAAITLFAATRPVPEPTPRDAYRTLVRRMRLGRAARGLLVDLAGAHGSATALALIGSGSAFDRAVRASGPMPPNRARALGRLERRVSRERRRLFAE